MNDSGFVLCPRDCTGPCASCFDQEPPLDREAINTSCAHGCAAETCKDCPGNEEGAP